MKRKYFLIPGTTWIGQLQLNNSAGAFLQNNHPTSHLKKCLSIVPIYQHKLLKVRVLNSQDLIITLFFFFFYCPIEDITKWNWLFVCLLLLYCKCVTVKSIRTTSMILEPLPWFMLRYWQFYPLLILHNHYLTTGNVHLFLETTAIFCSSVSWNTFGKSCIKYPLCPFLLLDLWKNL